MSGGGVDGASMAHATPKFDGVFGGHDVKPRLINGTLPLILSVVYCFGKEVKVEVNKN